MPHDLQKFLNWYLNPYTRLGRRGFNGILFIAFLPTLLMHLNSVKKMADGLAYDVQKISAGASYGGSANTTAQVKQILATLTKTDSGFNFSALLPYIIYALLVPVILMRLRDSGLDKRFVYAIFAPIILGAMQLITGLGLGMFFTAPLYIASFILLTILSIKGSAVRERSPHIPTPPPPTPPVDNNF